jgi:hypothetical protein
MNHIAEVEVTKAPVGGLGHLLKRVWTRFLFRWATYFGFIVSASNCPLCGRTGCPQGIASAGIMAGIIVAVTNGMRRSSARGSRRPSVCEAQASVQLEPQAVPDEHGNPKVQYARRSGSR